MQLSNLQRKKAVFDISIPLKNRPSKVLSILSADKAFFMVSRYIQHTTTRYKKMFTYLLIGGSAALIDIVLFTLLYEKFDIHTSIATTSSILISTLYGFFMNIFFNFRTFDHLGLRFLSYASVSVVAVILSTLCLFIFTEQLLFNGSEVKAISIIPIAFLQYILNRTFSFSTVRVPVKSKLFI